MCDPTTHAAGACYPPAPCSGLPSAALRPWRMQRLGWHDNDLKQVGADFGVAAEVAACDEQARLALQLAEYSNSVYADHIAVRPS
ncbi:hypothetical protein G5V57_00535 [Nordella sp. HKS 07]|uniref:hypothetical protein n=1 Tax=Nordella sp. HKS 07 TaxID=2712222 RepID=UPI0013E10FE5|nr:hypothetical protein [Nordella sp. HKS 07]QIG46374.1 hypothetical protein G5V57_00535 [Nordella sp. HKS 07]